MTKSIKRVIKGVIRSLLPIKKTIMFESVPDITDNSRAVFDEMVKRGLDKKYRLIWWIQNPNAQLPKSLKAKYVYSRQKIRFWYYRNTATCFVSCNTFLNNVRNGQTSLFLCHGSKSKKTRGKYEAPKGIDYILVQADVFKDALKYEYNLPDETEMVTLGYPRNDDLLSNEKIDFRSIINFDYKKLIVWYPTFRQHKNGVANVSDITLPIIHDERSAVELNDCAAKNGVLILLKPHFSQNTDYIKNGNLSNLKIINDEFLDKNGIRSYQLLNVSDALLTDYSSVYYDYLLKDSPIGLVWEDYDNYKKNQGFALDPDVVYSGGEKIYNINDFCGFVCRVSNDEDVLQNERNKIKDLTNTYYDGESSKRVVDFLMEKINKN